MEGLKPRQVLIIGLVLIFGLTGYLMTNLLLFVFFPFIVAIKKTLVLFGLNVWGGFVAYRMKKLEKLKEE